MADKVHPVAYKADISANTKIADSSGSIREENGKLILTIDMPKNKSLDEIVTMSGHSCHERCQGLITNAAAFVW